MSESHIKLYDKKPTRGDGEKNAHSPQICTFADSVRDITNSLCFPHLFGIKVYAINQYCSPPSCQPTDLSDSIYV